MEWMNYHHLLYFWTVAKEGSIARACEQLRLAQPTISGQLRQFEESLNEKLFTRAGRGLALTEVGQIVYRYADEIFSVGRELQDVLKGRPRSGRPMRLLVGISDAVPNLIAYRILQPVLDMSESVQLICSESRPERLLADLSAHELDVVLSDSPLTAGTHVKAYNHLLGSCGISLFAAPDLAVRYKKNFPACLDGAPFLLPMEGSSLRRSLEQWFESQKIRPRLVGEFQDSALMKTFGQGGAGLFAAPDAIEKEVRQLYRVTPVGRAESIVKRYYVISIERKLKHPAAVALSEAAREQLFA
ncbi:MAG: transcriptional activator NhaR [Acidobacteriaceae bacterium]|nr:transcriptional activator NhaR [Acidobacteriaceae bacterium]MBV9304777.1 transcriptional activator NhaR [Acidobacteriaceae bacterium]